MKKHEGTQGGSSRIKVSGIELEWQRDHGTCTFENLPVAMMWVDSTLAGLMSGLQAMVGPKRFTLALQSEGRKSVESDWTVISGHKEFQDGFRAIANIAAVAGWGEWELVSLDQEKREAVFKVRNNWEGLYQRSLGVCWGSGMLAGKFAGYCSRLWNVNCWATQRAFLAKGDPQDEFVVKPSSKSIEKEIDRLLSSDEETQADMAVAVKKLEKEVADRRHMEQELRESEEQFRSIVAHSHAGIYMADEDHFVYVNDRAAQMTGYSQQELVGMDFRNLLSEESLRRVSDYYLRRQRSEDVPSSYEFILTRKDGEKRIAEMSIAIITDAAGKKRTLGQVLDITERKNAEQALRESEERYRILTETSLTGIYIYQEDKVVYANQRLAAMGGYGFISEIIGKNIYELVHPDDREKVRLYAEARLKGLPAPSHYELRLLKKDGGSIWVEIHAGVTEYQGQPAFMGNFVDITARKLAEQETERRARELEALNSLGREIGADLSIESIVGTAIRHTCQSVGPDVSMVFLREGENLLLKGCMPADEFSSRKNMPIHRVGHCLCGLSVRGMEAIYCRNIHTDPRCTFMECKEAGFRSFAALPLVSGATVIGVLGVASRSERDFAEQGPFLEALSHEIAIGLNNGILYEKAQRDAIELHTRLIQIRKSEREKESLMAQLQQAQKMEAIGTLAGGIAHDFNNILSPIIMGTEVALMSVPAESEAHPLMQRVLTAGLRAKDLVNQILTFSRQSDLERIPLTVGPILKEAIKFARSSLPTTIEIRLDIGTKKDLIFGNPTQVHQVIMNLITNAAHAMREKGGVLEAVLREESLDEAAVTGLPGLTAGNFLKLTVRDTGHGMDRRTMEQVFDPFFTTKERGEGTGLGLSIVHGIIRSHEGAITVDSHPGEGTTFSIFLPLVMETNKATHQVANPIPSGTESILFVDDEAMITDTYSKMLCGLGYTVETKTNALDALEAFKNAPGRYDLVITDMTMPKMTGDALTVELLRIRPDLPVILCTGFSEQVTEARAIEIGARAFVMKPLVIRELANVIRKVIEGK